MALRDEDFGRVLGAGLLLIVIGTLTYALGSGWSVTDGLCSPPGPAGRRRRTARRLRHQL